MPWGHQPGWEKRLWLGSAAMGVARPKAPGMVRLEWEMSNDEGVCSQSSDKVVEIQPGYGMSRQPGDSDKEEKTEVLAWLLGAAWREREISMSCSRW